MFESSGRQYRSKGPWKYGAKRWRFQLWSKERQRRNNTKMYRKRNKVLDRKLSELSFAASSQKFIRNLIVWFNDGSIDLINTNVFQLIQSC